MTTVAALVAGLATSLHCAGMCGPIACGLGTLAKSESERLTAASRYHGTRLISYGIIGDGFARAVSPPVFRFIWCSEPLC